MAGKISARFPCFVSSRKPCWAFSRQCNGQAVVLPAFPYISRKNRKKKNYLYGPLMMTKKEKIIIL